MANRNRNRTRQTSSPTNIPPSPQSNPKSRKITNGEWLTFFGVIIAASITGYFSWIKPGNEDSKINKPVTTTPISNVQKGNGTQINPVNSGAGTQINPVNTGSGQQVIQLGSGSKTVIDKSNKIFNKSIAPIITKPSVNVSNKSSPWITEYHGVKVFVFPIKNYGQSTAFNVSMPTYIITVKNGYYKDINTRYADDRLKFKSVESGMDPAFSIFFTKENIKDTLIFVYNIKFMDSKNNSYESGFQYVEYYPNDFQKPLPARDLTKNSEIYAFMKLNDINL